MIIQAFKFIFLVLVTLIYSENSFAASALVPEICNMYNIATGSIGKIVASFAIVSVGVGFFSGRVSWGVLVGVCTGVGLMVGAPTVVSAITGKSIYQCPESSYVTSCLNGKCYTCPMGYTGSDCSSCGTGFTGPTCSDCAVGYTGTSCSECDVGYSKYNGVCYQNCSASSIAGVSSATVDAGVGTATCDSDNFSGSVSYSCINNNLSVTSYNCFCTGNFAGTNCQSCVTGYKGQNCYDCDDGYTKVDGKCNKNCMANVTGITSSTEALPPSGTLSCNDSGYSGSVDYTCSDGVFAVKSGQCVKNQCSGGTESLISSGGTTYKLHVFKSSGTFECYATKNVEYLVVGGGGGGGAGSVSSGTISGILNTRPTPGGGGGAGGFLTGSMSVAINSVKSITVGSGGGPGAKGGNSSIDNSVIAYGGGFGAYPNQSADSSTMLNGGSGGGGSSYGDGGSGVSGQGNAGAPGHINTGTYINSSFRGSGGGGAGAAGSVPGAGSAGDGGAGKLSSITGTALYYAGGGGGGNGAQKGDVNLACYYSGITFDRGRGGSNVGGIGGMGFGLYTKNGTDGAANTGSGGGGAGYCSGYGSAGSGAAGVVIIRYVYQ